MLTRLSKMGRFKAGWGIALIYLLCAVAPSASFAFGNGIRTAHCLTAEGLGAGPMNMAAMSGGVHMHDNAAGYTHSETPSQPEPSHDAANADQSSVIGTHGSGKHQADIAPCCELLCLTALPATLASMTEPSSDTFACESAVYRHLADSTAPSRYRPPIS